MNESGDTEKWEFSGGSWAVGGFSQVGAGKLTELEKQLKYTQPVACFSTGGKRLKINYYTHILSWESSSYFFKYNDKSRSGDYYFSVEAGETSFREDAIGGLSQLYFVKSEKKFYLFGYEEDYSSVNDDYIYLGTINLQSDIVIFSGTIPLEVNGVPNSFNQSQIQGLLNLLDANKITNYNYPSLVLGSSNLINIQSDNFKRDNVILIDILDYNFENERRNDIPLYGFYNDGSNYDTLLSIKQLGEHLTQLNRDYEFIRFDFSAPVNFNLSINSFDARISNLEEKSKNYDKQVDQLKYTQPVACFSSNGKRLKIDYNTNKLSWESSSYFFKYNDKSRSGDYYFSVEAGETSFREDAIGGLSQLYFVKSEKKFYLFGYEEDYSSVNDDYIYLGTINLQSDIVIFSGTIPLEVNGVPNSFSQTQIKNLLNIDTNQGVLTKSYDNSDIGNLDYQDMGDTDYSHIILYGQSLSQGFQSPRVITTESIEGNYMVGDAPYYGYNNNNATQLNPLKAVKYSSIGEEPIVSLVNSFSKLYRRFVNKTQKFIGSNPSQDGRSIEKLSKECTNGTTQENNLYMQRFYKLLTDTKSIVDGEGKTISCSAILYMQGEYNYTNLGGNGLTDGTDATNDKDTYKSLLLTLKNNMQSDVMSVYGQSKKPLFFIYQVAGSYINNKEMTINMAQIEFALENDDVFLLNPTYFTPDYSGGHLSTNGYRWYGEQMGKALYNVFVKGIDCKPIFPTNYTINGNKIIIDFYTPVKPLVLDTWTKEAITNMGFMVYNNGSEVTINAINIIDGKSIVLDCASALNGYVEIVYAGQGRNGSGNVRDSDRFHSMYTYFNDSEDSLKENYTPQDENGNKIYGMYYPMYNWLVAFYKKIEL